MSTFNTNATIKSLRAGFGTITITTLTLREPKRDDKLATFKVKIKSAELGVGTVFITPCDREGFAHWSAIKNLHIIISSFDEIIKQHNAEMQVSVPGYDFKTAQPVAADWCLVESLTIAGIETAEDYHTHEKYMVDTKELIVEAEFFARLIKQQDSDFMNLELYATEEEYNAAKAEAEEAAAIKLTKVEE